MAEFSLIEQYCKGLGVAHRDTRLSVGDDAAIVSIPPGQELAISVDTMVEGVHFAAAASADNLAHKLLAVNLSDMAAMGATPKWITVALTLPAQDQQWMSLFSQSLDHLANQYQVELIGGDMTSGSLTMSMQIMGLLAAGKGLTRKGAQLGDDVYISAVVGDAALALKGITNAESVNDELLAALHTPTPRVELGQKLLDVAHSCIDVSDGLVADLQHIVDQSRVSFELDVALIPVSKAYQKMMVQGGTIDLALSGGDDYELAFTAPQSSRDEIQRLSKKLQLPLTRIGKVAQSGHKNEVLLFQNGKPYDLKHTTGYQHFINE